MVDKEGIVFKDFKIRKHYSMKFCNAEAPAPGILVDLWMTDMSFLGGMDHTYLSTVRASRIGWACFSTCNPE